eukprot:2173921-Pleurochrysis_carterae.AAC.1
MPSETERVSEDRVEQLAAGLGAKVRLLLEVGAQAAGLREALRDGRIDKEDVVERAADSRNLLD